MDAIWMSYQDHVNMKKYVNDMDAIWMSYQGHINMEKIWKRYGCHMDIILGPY